MKFSGTLIFTQLALTLAANSAAASAIDGNWIFKKDNADQLDRAISLHGSSFQSLISTSEGVAWETGWWTENPGSNGRTSVIVRYGDNPPDTIEYKMENNDSGVIWLEGVATRWGVMNRSNCSLGMQYRNWTDPAPAGCSWLHIRGWGYSGLDGECMYDDDWAANPPPPGPMECLIEAPTDFTK